MTCSKCALWIRKSLESEPGILHANVSLREQKAIVRFDMKRTTVERILGNKAFAEENKGRGSNGESYFHKYEAELLEDE
jgi:copper chaperone CopZ